jgi:hypothetical protein
MSKGSPVKKYAKFKKIKEGDILITGEVVYDARITESVYVVKKTDNGDLYISLEEEIYLLQEHAARNGGTLMGFSKIGPQNGLTFSQALEILQATNYHTLLTFTPPNTVPMIIGVKIIGRENTPELIKLRYFENPGMLTYEAWAPRLQELEHHNWGVLDGGSGMWWPDKEHGCCTENGKEEDNKATNKRPDGVVSILGEIIYLGDIQSISSVSGHDDVWHISVTLKNSSRNSLIGYNQGYSREELIQARSMLEKLWVHHCDVPLLLNIPEYVVPSTGA